MKRLKYFLSLLILILALCLLAPSVSARRSYHYHAGRTAYRRLTRRRVYRRSAYTVRRSYVRKSRAVKTSTVTNTPDQRLASSVLTASVKAQLGASISYNGHGAFVINGNRNNLNAKVASAPYAVNKIDGRGRPIMGDALLNRTTRQYQNRLQTNNGATNWKPAGFSQVLNLPGRFQHAYDRGHLLGYALVGGIRKFNASESNPRNIATQTAWANEADSQQSTGQNYYEELVRKALDRNQIVRYEVRDIYNGNDLLPSGAQIEAKSRDNQLQFNVFVPNVQTNIRINYTTGRASRSR